jgi:hypothetical protein
MTEGDTYQLQDFRQLNAVYGTPMKIICQIWVQCVQNAPVVQSMTVARLIHTFPDYRESLVKTCCAAYCCALPLSLWQSRKQMHPCKQMH